MVSLHHLVTSMHKTHDGDNGMDYDELRASSYAAEVFDAGAGLVSLFLSPKQTQIEPFSSAEIAPH